MKERLSILFLLLVVCCIGLVSCQILSHLYHEAAEIEDPSKTLDFTCTACVIVTNGLIHSAGREREALKRALARLCTFLPREFNETCIFVVRAVGELVIESILRGDSPSKICNALQIFKCNGCSLSSPKEDLQQVISMKQLSSLHLPPLTLENLYKLSGTARRIVEKRNNPRVSPVIDNDKDLFSASDFLRGAHWRGKDCLDSNLSVRPGIKPENSDRTVDSDCNGILGQDQSSSTPYEDLFCRGNYGGKQVIIFGDSASSGFSIPLSWMQGSGLENLIEVLQNEFDHPQISFGTGQNETKIHSVYAQLRRRNLCNHRQYQNVGYNGGRMNDLSAQIRGLSLNSNSKPFIGIVNYIGNDLCKASAEMITTDADYLMQLKRGLDELEAISPPGSKLLIMGLVDGRILWKEMADRRHPGFVDGVPYANVYRFLDCTNANPCRTWLTVNATLREFTSRRGDELSRVAERFVMENHGNYKNIEIAFIRFPLDAAIEELRRRGRSPHELIEPVDGFHPSLYGHTVFGELIWKHILEKHPTWLGPVNPNNADIQRLFGDQGNH